MSGYVQLCLKGTVHFTVNVSLVWTRHFTVAKCCIIQLPLCWGKRLSVWHQVEEVVACLEVRLSVIAPSSPLSPEPGQLL